MLELNRVQRADGKLAALLEQGLVVLPARRPLARLFKVFGRNYFLDVFARANFHLNFHIGGPLTRLHVA